VSECQRAAEDIPQDNGHDPSDDESVMEAHIPCTDGDTHHWAHTEHLRHTLPGTSMFTEMLSYNLIHKLML